MQPITRLILAAALALAALFTAAPAGAADYRTASITVDTHANVLAKAGLYTHQRAYASDFNGAEVFWDGTAWLWATRCQIVLAQRADVTAPADTVDNELVAFTLPKLASRDQVRVSGLLVLTNNTNTKTATVKLGSLGAMANGMSTDLASSGVFNFVSEMHNAGSTSTQKWMSNNKGIFGALSGTVISTTKATGTAGVRLAVAMQKATAADSVVLSWLNVEICGGGVP